MTQDISKALAPFIAENLGGNPQFLVICDHASNRIPEDFAGLGLPAESLTRHIAYDIGAAPTARLVAQALDCPLVMSNFSRLLIDPNRGLDDPTLVMKLSDGEVIPGNRGVDRFRNPAAWQARIDSYYAPYHAAIATAIQRALDGGEVPILLSVHSFTPVWKAAERPWHAGVLWDKDPRLADVFKAEMAQYDTVFFGDNEPYSGRLHQDCLYRHGTENGIPHALIELRQDEVGTAAGQTLWADRVSAVMKAAGRNPALQLIQKFGTYTA